MKNPVLSYRWILATVIVLLACGRTVAMAHATDTGIQPAALLNISDADDNGADIDDALEAVREGRAMPLSKLETIVTSRFDGEVINVEIARKKNQLLYEFKVLRPEGRITEVEVNATTGKIEEVEND
jgi:uncharacterized membrane protein YkoI